jgi:N-acetylglucosaminyldiphosphoundecaprenol N-acetyl-beta-D-mannosaminyltransferase
MCPPLGFERDRRYMRRLLARLRSARPDIAFVGLGSPKQEYLIERVHRLLPRTWFLGVGISFSFVCGEIPRAPRVLQYLGLEWMHRLVYEPRRLAKRYLVQGIPFAMQLFATAVWRRFGREPAMRPSHAASATGV